MKVHRVYEVWVGGGMVDDDLTMYGALELAREEWARELKEYPNDKPDVFIDEHTYIRIEDYEDLDLVDFVPRWREMDDAKS